MDVTRAATKQSTAPSNNTAAPKSLLSARREAGYFALITRRLRRDRSAMLGAVLVLLITLTGLLAPLIAPHDPSEQFRDGLTKGGQPMPTSLMVDGSSRYLLERMLTAAIFLVASCMAQELVCSLVY